MNRVGAVYGQSLYLLAREEGLEDTLLQQLQVLEETFSQQPDYLKLLSSHELPKQERTALLEEVLRGKVHQYVLNFLKLLTEKGYIRHFADCYKAFQEQYHQDQGILAVRVLTAMPLAEEQKQRLSDKLAAITGKTVQLSCREDPSVLGGVLLQYDGKQVDGTVQGRLAEMEKRLKNTVL